jgi:thermostable 8-oxoguanine DNA glycosylase
MTPEPMAEIRAALSKRYWDGADARWRRWELQMVSRAETHPRESFSRPEIEEIAKWKNREQLYEKVERDVRKNTPSEVRSVTTLAFSESEPERAIEILACHPKLKGVGYAVASAILMFHDPREYTVIDKNAWYALYLLNRVRTPEPPPFSGKVYANYNVTCRRVSSEWGVGLRETDRMLWSLGS